MRGERVIGVVIAAVMVASVAGGAVVAGEKPGGSVENVGDGRLSGDVTGVETTGGRTDGGTRAVQTTDSEVVVTYTIERTDDPERLRVRGTVEIPPSVDSLRVRLPTGADELTATGFSRPAVDLVWNGSTRRATFAYTRSITERDETFGEYDFAGTEEWALFDLGGLTPSIRTDPVGSVTVTTRYESPHPFHAGSEYAYIGSHTTTVREGIERFELVTPDESGVQVDRRAVFGTLGAAEGQLRVGGRNGTVTIFAVQPPIGGGGRARGDDAIVYWSEPTTNTNNVWIHEYVHTRQSYYATGAVRWFDEGSAEYYAALLTWRQGNASFGAFYDHVTPTESGVLSEPRTWETDTVEYTKGSRVLAALDARIRRETGGNRTLQDVFLLLNQHEGLVSAKTFRETVVRVGGESLRAWLDRYVEGSETPRVPRNASVFRKPDRPTDPDGDGLDRSEEIAAGTNPFAADTDDDGLSDSAELERGTDPREADTDGDSVPDGREVDEGTDPLATPAATATETADEGAVTTASPTATGTETTVAESPAETTTSGPGFTAVVLVAVAIVATALLAVRSRG